MYKTMEDDIEIESVRDNAGMYPKTCQPQRVSYA